MRQVGYLQRLYHQFADLWEWNGEERQLMLYSGRDLPLVPHSTRPLHYCSYPRWTALINPEEQQILLSSPTLEASELDHSSSCVDTMKIRCLNSILYIDETHIHTSTQYYSYLCVLIPSFVVILCTCDEILLRKTLLDSTRKLKILPCAKLQCVISNFRREVADNCALLGYYGTGGGNSLPTFRDNLSVPASRVENLDTW